MRAELFSLMFFAFCPYTIVVFGPELWKDVATDKATIQPARDYQVKKSQCVTNARTIVTCNYEFARGMTGETIEFSHMTFGKPSEERIAPMRRPDGVITSNIGASAFGNRLATFLVTVIMSLSFAILMTYRAFGLRTKSISLNTAGDYMMGRSDDRV